jgi:hypothetical protein
LRLGLGRHRIDFGHIDEIDAALEGVVELGVTLGLAVLLAEGHGAEAQRRYLHAAPAKFAIIHARGSLAGARVQLDGPGILDLLVGLFGGEKGGGDQPQHEGRNRQQCDSRANFAEM